MPIYEYQCRACEHRLEKLQKLSDAPLTTCPECEEDALVKLVSAAGFRLKGGGWYETDFKKDGRRNLAADPADTAGGKSDGKADGKSEAKSDGGSDGGKASGEAKPKTSGGEKNTTKSGSSPSKSSGATKAA